MHEQVYGVSFAVKILKNIKLEMALVVWNFTGQDRYKSIQPHYMKGVSGILLLFDLTRHETFDKLSEWISFIRSNDTEAPILLIGSKADLFDRKTMSDAEIEDFTNTNKLQGYYEVSFKSGLNVELVLKKMGEMIYQSRVYNRELPIGFKLIRKYPDRPLIIDEQKVQADYILTLRTIYDIIYNDVTTRLKNLEKYLKIKEKKEEIPQLNVVKELDTILKELASHHKTIEILQENPPVQLASAIKIDLVEEWKRTREKLLYHIFIFKDVYKFLLEL